jgi:hypothetical protein
MAVDLFPGGLEIRVGMNSLDAASGRWGVLALGPDTVAGWPAGQVIHFWTYNRIAWATAAGIVNSGVVATGPTDPDGWRDFPADSTDWLMQNVARYCLIGAFTLNEFPSPDEWFFMGSAWGSSLDHPNPGPITWSFPMSPNAGMPPAPEPWAGPAAEWRRMFLACNRPPPGPFGGGDGLWSVTLNVQTLSAMDAPTCSPPPATRSIICSSQIGAMQRWQRAANQACTQITQSNADITNHLDVFTVAVSAWTIIGIGLAVATAGNFFVGGTAQSALAAIHTSIVTQLIVGGAGLAAGAAAALVGELEAALGALAALLSAGTAELVALALAKAPMLGGWVAVIIIGAICLLLIAALLVAIVELGLLLAAIRQHNEDRTAFNTAQANYSNAVAGAFRFCCPAVVMADPTPGLLIPPTCGSG